MIGQIASILAVAAIGCGGAYAVSYNRLIRAREAVADAWAQIETELARRHSLIPRLVEAAERAAVHERSLLEHLVQQNQHAIDAPHTAHDANVWQPPLADAIAQVVALRENYPALNTQHNFLGLQRELTTTEDRLAAARRYYNTRVERLNRRIEAFPSRLVAARHDISSAEFFS